MEVKKHMSLLALVFALGVTSSLKFGCGSIVGGEWNKGCIESEIQGLLLFKTSLVDDSNYLSSWVGDDCCAWHGIRCNNRTGHVMQLDLRNGGLGGDEINPSLLELKYLTHLDLSFNNFEHMQIPEFLGSFKDLTYLNLSHSNFEGIIPQNLGNLSRLRYLDLNDNYLLIIGNMGWSSKLSLLEHLDLTFVNLSRATDWFPAINMLPNLVFLSLFSCNVPNNIPSHLPFINLTSLNSLNLGGNRLNSFVPLWVFNISGLAHLNLGANDFHGQIPESIGRLTSLLELDLSNNNFSGSILKSIGSLTSLSSLDLSHNEFQGSIPESIGRLTSLTNLDLHFNNFQGLIPKSIGSLTFLTNLDLRSNNLQGLIPHSIGNLTSLYTLNLSKNKLNDSLPPQMGNLKELTDLRISSNELSGCLPQTLCQLSKLEMLDVNYNQLSGSIPECIGKLSNLGILRLHSNSWEGFLSEHHFVNLTSLTSLSISSKSNLILNVSSKWLPVFQLEDIQLESLKVGPKYPRWLLTQRQITLIRMRNTSISYIPSDWFESVLFSQVELVDLSNNDINVEHLSLISAGQNDLQVLALSNNRLSGEFPAFICNLTSLSMLVLSNNNFSGELPRCLGSLTELTDLDVMNNSLSGDIPVSLGSLVNLTYLNLHNNKFQGKIPLSFQNLTKLVVLDVGKNNLSDIVPAWTEMQLPYLKYLILRSNNFYGNIPPDLCHHSSIQVLNLARNQITGHIPPCFGNFSAMITSGSIDLYQDITSQEGEMIIDDAKGYELKYTSTLKFLFSIDLSINNISGEIPEELMDLNGLSSLNLAGNHLAGRIPDRIGKLKNLEFLDLSENELIGPVPQSLSDLNFLSHLNLSFNDLSGRIPSGNQLETLGDPSIYAGNNQLCGRPILKPCAGDTELDTVDDYNKSPSFSDSDDELLWFYAGIGPGLVVGLMGVYTSLYFISSWRYTYFYFVEQISDKIVVAIVLFRRKFHN